MKCSVCQSEAVIAVSPGIEEDIAEAGILVRRGRADRRWCIRCWPSMPPQPDLFGEAAS